MDCGIHRWKGARATEKGKKQTIILRKLCEEDKFW